MEDEHQIKGKHLLKIDWLIHRILSPKSFVTDNFIEIINIICSVLNIILINKQVLEL